MVDRFVHTTLKVLKMPYCAKQLDSFKSSDPEMALRNLKRMVRMIAVQTNIIAQNIPEGVLGVKGNSLFNF